MRPNCTPFLPFRSFFTKAVHERVPNSAIEWGKSRRVEATWSHRERATFLFVSIFQQAPPKWLEATWMRTHYEAMPHPMGRKIAAWVDGSQFFWTLCSSHRVDVTRRIQHGLGRATYTSGSKWNCRLLKIKRPRVVNRWITEGKTSFVKSNSSRLGYRIGTKSWHWAALSRVQ